MDSWNNQNQEGVCCAEVAEQAADALDTALRELDGPLQQDAAHPGSLEDWLPMEEEAALQLHAVRSTDTE